MRRKMLTYVNLISLHKLTFPLYNILLPIQFIEDDLKQLFF